MTDDKHDTTPPPSGPPTSPLLPDVADVAPIAAGKAHLVVSAGFLEVLGAMARLEAVCAAVARQLDATAAAPTSEGQTP